MRRLYISTMAACEAHRTEFATHLTTHWLALYDPALPGDKERWEAAGRPVAVSAEHSDEHSQDRWEENPEVTVMPDPIFEGNMPMEQVMGKAENLANTHNGIEHIVHPAHTRNIGIEPTDTVVQVHAKLARWHKGYKLRPYR